jgi:hypothetical protein
MNALSKALIRQGINTYMDKPMEYIAEALLKKKGQLARIKYIRPLHLRAGYDGAYAFKTTNGVFQVGVTYDKKDVVISKRESGELPPINQGLNGCSWIVPNYFLIGKDNKILVRLNNVKNAFKEIKYELNNCVVGEDILKQVCLASEFDEEERTVFNVELAHIVEVV